MKREFLWGRLIRRLRPLLAVRVGIEYRWLRFGQAGSSAEATADVIGTIHPHTRHVNFELDY
jgi:hypothetical protein